MGAGRKKSTQGLWPPATIGRCCARSGYLRCWWEAGGDEKLETKIQSSEEAEAKSQSASAENRKVVVIHTTGMCGRQLLVRWNDMTCCQPTSSSTESWRLLVLEWEATKLARSLPLRLGWAKSSQQLNRGSGYVHHTNRTSGHHRLEVGGDLQAIRSLGCWKRCAHAYTTWKGPKPEHTWMLQASSTESIFTVSVNSWLGCQEKSCMGK